MRFLRTVSGYRMTIINMVNKTGNKRMNLITISDEMSRTFEKNPDVAQSRYREG